MGDSSAANSGERFMQEFGADYQRVSGFGLEQRWAIVSHGLVYDDFNREVKYGVRLAPVGWGTGRSDVDVVVDEPAAYDTQHGDPADEIDRVARDLGLSRAEILVRFKRAGLVDEEFSLADFPPELTREEA